MIIKLNHYAYCFQSESAIVWTKDLIANPSTIKKILKPKIKSYRKEATIFMAKKSLN